MNPTQLTQLAKEYQTYVRKVMHDTPREKRLDLIVPFELYRDGKEGKLFLRENQIPSMIQPVFLSKKIVETAMRKIELADRMMLQIADIIQENDSIRLLLQVSDFERGVLQARPDSEALLPMWRADMNMDESHPLCVEFNTDAARGRGVSDRLQILFSATPLMQGFLKNNLEVQPDHEEHIVPELYEDTIEQFERFSGNKFSGNNKKKNREIRVAVLQWKDYGFPPEMYMYQNFWHKRNIEADIVDPRDIVLHDSKVMGTPWDTDEQREYSFFQRWVDLDKLIERKCSGVFESYFRGLVSIYPTLGSGILGKKALFVLLSDPHYKELFDQELWEQVTGIIPWTRILKDEDSQMADGSTSNIVDFVRASRNLLVIKASVGTEGKQVVVGPDVTEKEWSVAVGRALQDAQQPGKQWIVQSFVEWSRETLLGFDGEELTEIDKSYDFLPYFTNGKYTGNASRCADGNILNFMAGATIIQRYFL